MTIALDLRPSAQPPVSLAFSNASESLIVQSLCRDLLIRGINLDISAADEMLLFFLYSQGHELEQAVAMYLDSGGRIWRTERQILAWRFQSLSWGGAILDFASGYGRVTRHIVADVEAERVWVADIYAEGVAFQERHLGVHGMVSTTEPEDFHCDQRFDAILVSSLFTHLPEPRFIRWLRRLTDLLNPGGVLLFSVHDMSLYPEAVAAGTGIIFRAHSESGSLDAQDYGTSWVTEAFVRAAVETVAGACPLSRIPRGLASYQDLYVVLKEPAGGSTAALPALRLEREADGFLEHCSWTGRRSLRLSGWIGDRVTGKPPGEVLVRIDGRLVATCRNLERRPAVGEAFASDPMEVVGWQATVDLPASSTHESAHLSVWGVSSAGEELRLYSGPVLWACLRSSQLDTVMVYQQLRRQEAVCDERLEQQRFQHEARLAASAAEAAALDRRVRGMEASRFWKARNLWFRMKRAAGLTDEP
jgi:SAM-dependent methyltransferase